MAESLDAALQRRGLQVCSLPTKGRCLFAAKHFSPGEVVLDQSPYVAVLNSYVDRRCDGCYREDCSLLRCASCKSVWYCSTSCQKRESSIHKYECKCLVTLMADKGRDLTPTLRLMLRLLIKRFLEKDKAGMENTWDNYELVDALPTHFEETPEQQLVLYAQMANLVKLTFVFEDVDIKEIANNFCRFACNAHTICDAELRPLGVGLYPVISIVNHSCHPNCILLFERKKAYVRAIQEIGQGTEITVSYVDLGESTSTRLQNLRKQYFFDCTCARCLSQDPSDVRLDNNYLEGFVCPVPKCRGLLVTVQEDAEGMVCKACGKRTDKSTILNQVKTLESLLTDGLKELSTGNLREARQAFERLDQLQAPVLQKSSLHRIKTYDNLLKVCMSMEDWTSSLSYCHKAISVYERVYLPNHPLLGLQYYTCGKLEWYLGNTVEAGKSYRKQRLKLCTCKGNLICDKKMESNL
ncbi:hypothetical protein GOP47_0026398 [Adiantum capillus-veneris]|nr:hypothetical protein GOP47_0026398 [Adiantum capillus-veneris]